MATARCVESHPIVTIPSELRGHIFNFISQEQVLSLRFVCTQWNEDIKSYYNFSIKLDERSPFFTDILQLRIRNLEIVQLLGNLDIAAHQKTTIFKHPKLIETLILTQIEDETKISSVNLQSILQQCSKSLQSLVLTLSYQLIKHQFTKEISYDFKDLQKLDINFFIRTQPNATASPFQIKNTLISQIGNSSIPNLKSLSVGVCNETLNLDMSTFFVFNFKLITKNMNGLERLCIRMWNKHQTVSALSSTSSETPIPTSESQLFKNLKKIVGNQNMILDFFPTIQEEGIWSSLIQNQTNLKNINASYKFPISKGLFHSLIANNISNIVHISIASLVINGHRGFDMTIFKHCYNIRSFDICRSSRQARSHLMAIDAPDLFNLFCLPESICYLKLTDFQILSEEIVKLLNTNLVKSLNNLYLMNCGVSGNLGVNVEVLKKIVDLGEDTSIELIRVFLEGFNSSGAEAQKKFHELFDRLGCSRDNLDVEGFRLVFLRDSNNRLRLR